jgi:hypothetical protein
MKIHIQHGDIHLTDLQTRMPFKYGIATMTRTPHVFLRLEVEVDGQHHTGISADSLPPKWFTKDPDRAVDEEVAEMLEVIEYALATATGLRAETAFAAWRELYGVHMAWGRRRGFPPLLSGFGAALVERALVDAVCRAVGRPFAAVLRTNQLGFRLEEVHASLAGKTPADFLPEQPLSRITIRQTVGLADPLDDNEIAVNERLHDGLPQSLSACIAFYGLRHFKIKVSGHLEHDRERLLRIARVLAGHAARDYAFTLDGNEQFHTLPEFREFWETLLGSQELREFFQHLLFVEQPFHRGVALRGDIVGGLAEWRNCPVMIIDESDGDLDSLPQALALGYAGASYKNCKGLFKGVINYCLLKQRQREQPARPAIMSGEDLVNIGPVALLQDLAVCAALGLGSVERNGHHYFRGLSMFPPQVQQQVLRAHADLYRASSAGWPALKIDSGAIALDSVNAAPFGVGFELDIEMVESQTSM